MQDVSKGKSINWDKLKARCPTCSSIKIKKTGVFKNSWVQIKKKYKKEIEVRWELKEFEECICLDCKNKWWK